MKTLNAFSFVVCSVLYCLPMITFGQFALSNNSPAKYPILHQSPINLECSHNNVTEIWAMDYTSFLELDTLKEAGYTFNNIFPNLKYLLVDHYFTEEGNISDIHAYHKMQAYRWSAAARSVGMLVNEVEYKKTYYLTAFNLLLTH